jgi:hypothetical protein
VLQELKAIGDIPVFYWAREGSGKAEVDFVLQLGDKVVPLEVKAERNLKANSLKVYIDFYKPSIAIRSSLEDLSRNLAAGNARENNVIFDIPLYMIGKLMELHGAFV